MPDHNSALHWASKVIPYRDASLVKSSPWSFVYRLTIEKNIRVFLKAETYRGANEYRILPVLHSYFPQHIPEQLYSARNRKYQALKDIGMRDRKPDIAQVLKVYAAIQQSGVTAQLPFLKHASHSALLNRFLRELKGTGRPGFTLLKLFGRRQLNAFGSQLAANSKMLRRYFMLSDHLPLVLSHNDLHISNTCLDRKGNVVIYDWSDTVIAPFGHCLSSLTGAMAVFRLLILEQADDPATSRAVRKYIHSFFPAGLSPLLKHAIVASVAVGAINNCLLLLDFPPAGSSLKAFYKQQIEGVIIQLLNIIQHTATVDFVETY
jgi:hypothetical protein